VGAGAGSSAGRTAPPRAAGASFAVARKARRKQERQEKGQRVRARGVGCCVVRGKPHGAATADACATLLQRAQYSAPHARDAADDGEDADTPAAATARRGSAAARPAAGAAAAAAAPKRRRDAPPAAAFDFSEQDAPPARDAKRAKPAPARAAAAPPRPSPLLAAHQQKLRDDIEAELRLQRSLHKKLKGRTVRPARHALMRVRLRMRANPSAAC
jgi:hypothetical protein